MTPSRALAASTFALAALAAGALGAGAQSSDQSAASNIGGFDRIDTAHVKFNYSNGDFTLPDHFTATSKGTQITADRATGNSKNKIMHAEGNVVVHQDAQTRASGQGAALTQKPSTLTCDRLDVDGSRKLYTATGNMHFSQIGGRDATAESAVLDDATHHLHMQGNVHVKNGEQTLNANTVDYDTLSGQVEADGNVTITTPAETPEPGPPRTPVPRKKRLL